MSFGLSAHRTPRDWYGRLGKRCLDIGSVLLLAVFWVPLLLLVMALVRLKLGSPVFFVQKRGGFLCAPFDLFKMRSMTDERNEKGELLPDDARLTRFGRFLRSSSLDELPSLFNILKGQMSLVGPRPFVFQYMALYPKHVRRRHDALPGLTGWSQINGRNAISWEEKFELDLWYVDNMSLRLDLRILLATLKKVIQKQDINSEGNATTEYYQGESPEE
jgi:lipopolysaccharide/colanic/teichoic acid biosynthesis glycosyltransferase